MQEHVEVAYLPVWRRYRTMFRDAGLTDMQKGKLLNYMMDYQFDGVEPQAMSPSLTVAWAFVKKDMDDARVKYETAVRNGKKGGRPKGSKNSKPKKTQDNRQEGISIPTTIPIPVTIPISIPNTDTDSAPACEEAGVSVEKNSYGEFGWVKLTRSQYEDLERRMGASELRRCITYVDESAQTTGNRNRWKDWYLLLRRCHDRHWHEIRSPYKADIPTGASGELGEAELEAIRMVLADATPGEGMRYEI